MGTPQVTPLNENRHAGGYMVLGDRNISNDPIVLASGAGVCLAGLVLGQITVGAAAYSAAGATGNPTCGAITVAQPAVAGEYDIVMDDATHFHVLQPPGGGGGAGLVIGHGVFGTAFNAGGLGFTLTAGGTACVGGDLLKITVAAGSGKWKAYDPTANDGTEVARGVLWAAKDATSADKNAAATVRGPAKVNAAELVWGANVTTNNHKTAAYASLLAAGVQHV